jgi:hypothetical protein
MKVIAPALLAGPKADAMQGLPARAHGVRLVRFQDSRAAVVTIVSRSGA